LSKINLQKFVEGVQVYISQSSSKSPIGLLNAFYVSDEFQESKLMLHSFTKFPIKKLLLDLDLQIKKKIIEEKE